MRWIGTLGALGVIFVSAACLQRAENAAPSAQAVQQRPAEAPAAARNANFDYYLLSLSWSPEFCAGPTASNNGQQCGEGRRYGFVVHGLWPQAEGGNPQNCGQAAQVPRAVIDDMLPLMPSSRLIQHEWAAHGTCSGLAPREYFDEVKRAYGAVNIPVDYKQPVRQIMNAPDDIRAKFAKANPSVPARAFRLRCGGRYLSEVRVCLTTDLKGMACPSDVRDNCRGEEVIMRPVR